MTSMTTGADDVERQQKLTYTNWVNMRLESNPAAAKVRDLYDGLRTGVTLCHLTKYVFT